MVNIFQTYIKQVKLEAHSAVPGLGLAKWYFKAMGNWVKIVHYGQISLLRLPVDMLN